MNYVIDQGNTRIKGGTFEGTELKQIWTWNNEGEALKNLETIVNSNFIISAVSGDPESLRTILGQAGNKVLILDGNTKLPIVNQYKSPETLGVDRLASVCGAKTHFPDRNCLVVDFGSCITYDFIDYNNNYLGGAITPGMKMRFKAMNLYTDNLPSIEDIPSSIPDFGQTTVESMTVGVLQGILGEVERFTHIFNNRYSDLQVLFCGGDANRFESMTKDPIFAAPNLVLEGLNSILTYNNEELE